MAKLTRENLENIISHRLRLREPEFRLERAGARWVGSIISPTFKGKRDHERQKAIWDVLERELGADSVRLVGMLLAYTPDEWNLGNEQEKAPRVKKAG